MQIMAMHVSARMVIPVRKMKGCPMATENEYYVCDICGMVVQVRRDGSGTLSCCSEDMRLVTEEEAKKLMAE